MNNATAAAQEIIASGSAASIVVGIDGTSASWDALAWAVEELAAKPVAGEPRRMLLCRSYPPDTMGARLSNPPDMTWLNLADPALTGRIRQLRQLPDNDVGVSVHVGDLAGHLVGCANTGTLTVVPAALGDIDTAAAVAARAPGIVVAVRPTAPRTDVTGGPFAGRVVVGVDGSASSQAAVGFAFDFAERHGRKVAAVHANADDPGGAWIDDNAREFHLIPHAFEFDLVEGALSQARCDHPDIDTRTFVLREQADPALIDASAGAALLVVGDRGRGALARHMLGSVSQRAVRAAHCTVAVVHASAGSS